jgi:leader peptidase (prepilin peptidase)/N-methyltransferase
MGIEVFGNPAWLAAMAGVFGLLIGSFLNVVIYRVPVGESIVFPPSHCPACDAVIKPWQNVPVVSYLLLRGRCANCGVHISLRYPAVELFTGCIFAGIAWRFGLGAPALLWMAFASALIVAAMIDLDHQIIPDEISLGGLVAGLVLTPLLLVLGGESLGPALLYAGGGAALGAGLLWTVGFFHARVCVAMGREFEHWPGEDEEPPRFGTVDYWTWFPGLGFGDVKLLAMIGAFLGPWGVLQTIVCASLAGLALGLLWAAIRGNLHSPFGFAPAIAAGALLAMLIPQNFFLIF